MVLAPGLCPGSPRPAFPSPLEGTGRTCWGHFTHTATTLNWKLPFSRCRSTYTVLAHDGLKWSLKVNKGAACSFERIEVESALPSNPEAGFWNVTGYVHANDVGLTTAASQSCAMYRAD